MFDAILKAVAETEEFSSEAVAELAQKLEVDFDAEYDE